VFSSEANNIQERDYVKHKDGYEAEGNGCRVAIRLTERGFFLHSSHTEKSKEGANE